jgi:hypothetical protein
MLSATPLAPDFQLLDELRSIPDYTAGLLVATAAASTTCNICAHERPIFVRHRRNNDGRHADASALCPGCVHKTKTSGVTMSGQSLLGVKCPCCSAVFGDRLGNCPDGRISVKQSPGWHTVTLITDAGVSEGTPYRADTRTVYFEDTQELRDLSIIERVESAYDRRLVLSVGTSVSNGTFGVVWSGLMHFKTSTSPGAHGYPAPGYLPRLDADLKRLGI